MRIPALGRRSGRLARLALIPAVAVLLAACTDAVNTNPTGDSAAPGLFTGDIVTTQGNEAASLYVPVFIVATIVFILIEGLLIYMAFRFRRRSTGDDLPTQTHGNNKLEIVWTVIPAIVVTVMFIGSTMVLANIETKSDDPDVVVNVKAFQFGWTFDYPQNGISITGGGREGAPQMWLPIDATVHFNITASEGSVIHSFYVPSFFRKLDAIPGRVNQFEVTIEQPGVYGGQCAEFCGLAHSDMFFSVNAVAQDEYDAWVIEQTGGGDADSSDVVPEAEAAADVSTVSPEGAVLAIASIADEPIAFTTTSLEAKAGQAVTVDYTNDTKVPHNIAFFDGPDPSAGLIVQSETVTGPGATTSVAFMAPATPGAYLFRCQLHPTQMIGTLTVTA